MRYIANLLLALGVFVTQSSHAQVSVWTYHNDNARTGANTNETLLTPSNVNTNSFGKLYSCAVDGYIYAQPLYIPNVTITNNSVHNVVFVVTENDSVYAFDADNNSGSNSTPLWKVSTLVSNETTVTTADAYGANTPDIVPVIGTTSTPVIDTNAGTIYVLAKSKVVNGGTTNFLQRLHALDIRSGSERSNSPALIQATVSGHGDGSSGGNLAFNPLKQLNRSALLLLSNTVYIGWASHGDIRPYHGWIMGYDKSNLTQVSLYCTAPNGTNAGVWQGGNGPAADTNGNFFVMTGNGWYDGPTNGDYGDSFLKLTTTNGATNLTLGDWFTPYNQFNLGGTTTRDSDIGSGGPLLLPDAVGSTTHKHLIVGAGKGNSSYGGVTIYLIDRDSMGHYNAGGTSDPNIVQEVSGQLPVPQMSTPTYWNYRLYYVAYNDYVHAFSISNAVLSTTPVDSSTTKASSSYGCTMSISANGSSNGILWVIDPYKGTTSNSVVHAYNASSLTTELWNSAMAGSRDTGPGGVKFTVPTIANGKVYVGGQASLVVYGNSSFSSAPIISPQPQSQSVNLGSNVTFYFGVAGTNTNYTTRWYFDGTLVAGATTTNYTITNTPLSDAGYYYTTVSNTSGVSTSSYAYLSVFSPTTNSPGAVIAPSGLVDWWPADGNMVDIVGGNNGTPMNNMTYTNGKNGLAFQFDGVSSYINVGAANIAPPWTLCVWAYRESSLSNGSIILGDSSKYYIKLEQDSLGTNSFQPGITQLGFQDSLFSYITPSNTWFHLAFVASTTNVSLYANGAFQSSITTNNFPLPRSYIGTGYTGSKFINILHGALDDIQTYNRMLTPTEINSIFSAGSASLVRAPQVTGFSGTNGQITIGMSGLTGRTFTIYTATNILGPWTAVTNLSGANGTNIYTDPITTNNTAKYYGIRQP